jgi:hypothetical protein
MPYETSSWKQPSKVALTPPIGGCRTIHPHPLIVGLPPWPCDPIIRLMTKREREDSQSNHELTLLRCGGCCVAWLTRAGRLLTKNEDRCLRCGGALEADG